MSISVAPAPRLPFTHAPATTHSSAIGSSTMDATALADTPARTEASSPEGHIEITGIRACQCCPAEPLRARPGETTILFHADGPAEATALFEEILGLRRTTAQVLVGGTDLHTTEPTQARRMIGYAAARTARNRGTIARAVRYRRPDLPPDDGTAALEKAGLTDTIADLPHGQSTRLTRGGEPLSSSERARLLMARAALGAPELLLVNHLDHDLDQTDRALLNTVNTGHPGVVIIYTGRAETTLGATRTWPEACHASSARQSYQSATWCDSTAPTTLRPVHGLPRPL